MSSVDLKEESSSCWLSTGWTSGNTGFCLGDKIVHCYIRIRCNGDWIRILWRISKEYHYYLVNIHMFIEEQEELVIIDFSSREVNVH